MPSNISPKGAAELNSFSVKSVLQDLWDGATNTFNQAVTTTGSILTAKAAEALAKAQARYGADRQNNLSLPTVPVSAGLDNRTMVFLAVAGISIFLLLKKAK